MSVDYNNYIWSEFTVHVYCQASTEELFKSWATCRGLESFFIKTAALISSKGARGKDEIAQPGDRYEWEWIHEYKLSGEVVAVDPGRSITYTFGPMKFSVEILADNKLSLVRLRQFDMPVETEAEKASNHVNCRSCWVFFLTNLKAVVEGGSDLRINDPVRSDYPAVHFEPPQI